MTRWIFSQSQENGALWITPTNGTAGESPCHRLQQEPPLLVYLLNESEPHGILMYVSDPDVGRLLKFEKIIAQNCPDVASQKRELR